MKIDSFRLIGGSACPLWGVVALTASVLLAADAAPASEVLMATLSFETETVALASGTVSQVEPMTRHRQSGDIVVAYNALRPTKAVVVRAPGSGAELAFATGVAFDGITTESLVSLAFSPEVLDIPFRGSDTVVVRTASGAVYKLGNAVESAETITFNYSRLD